MTTPPWDTKAPKENVIGWHTGGFTDAGVDVTFAVTDSTKLEDYTDAFDTIVDSGMSTHQTYMALAALSEPSSLSPQSPLGAKILPVEQTIRRWRVGTGKHAS